MKLTHMLAASIFLASGPALARTVDVEVIEQQKNASPQTLKLALSIGDTGCSRLTARVGKGSYSVEACVESKGTLGVKLQQIDASIEGSGPGTAGTRTVLGRVDRPDGSTLEVAMTPR